MLFNTRELWKNRPTGWQNTALTDCVQKCKWRHDDDVIIVQLTAGTHE